MVQRALGAGATLVALAFGLSTFERWLARRRRHELAWSVALLLFAAASGCLWLGASSGWNAPVFRLFFLFGAIADVPVLAVGTVYLLGGSRRGDAAALAVTVFCAFAAGVVAVAPMTGPVPAGQLPRGSQVFGALPRVLAAAASGVGAMVVLGGAAWSAWRYRGGRMAGANVLIAAGTLVLGGGGILNSVVGAMEAFAITLVAGVSLLFAGFLVAVTPPRPAGPVVAPSRPVPEGATPRS